MMHPGRTLGAAVLIVTAVVGGSARAQTPSLNAQLFAARDTVWRAWFANDTALLKRFVPSAAVEVGGDKDWRWGDRKSIGDGSREFVRSKGKLIDLKFGANEVLHSGGTALVRSEYQLVTESAGKIDTTKGRAMELFVKHGNTWVNPYWQLIPWSVVTTMRDVPLPDTLGANFAIGDSTAQRGATTDYDPLIGTWEFKYQSRRPDGSYNPAFPGHWTFDKKPGDGLVEDRWRSDNPTAPMAASLYTYRVFDPKKKAWAIMGSSSTGGTIQPGWTWADANNIYVIQWSSSETLSRIRYQNIEANHFLWRSDFSNDGGKTWLLDAAVMEAKRIGK